MTEPVIVDGVRTPHGAFLGSLADSSAIDLGVTALEALADRTGVDEAVEWLGLGNAISSGVGQVPARQVGVGAGLPEEVPATTINEASGSGLRALALAVDRVRLGRIDCAVAGGMESMSNAPYLAEEMRSGRRHGNSELVDSMIRDALWDMMYDAHMGELTEELVDRFDIEREAQDRYALQSHERAVEARKQGVFEGEIATVNTGNDTLEQDEGPRLDTTLEKLADLDPFFREDGTVTAGNASDLSDGAATVMVTSREFARENDLEPRARVVDYAVQYRDPKWFPLAVEDAVERLLDRNALSVDDVDFFEMNEAFAAHMVHFREELGVPMEKLNVRGGAVALGHPIGASGGILTTTLLHTLRDEDARYGVAGMCVGGGGGIAVLLENTEAGEG
jgi:acetyl-CoA C-acetyltransferase